MYPTDDTEARLRLLIRESAALRRRVAREVERSRALQQHAQRLSAVYGMESDGENFPRRTGADLDRVERSPTTRFGRGR